MASKVEELALALSKAKFVPPSDSDFEELCPFLWEMMTLDKWADGTDRIPSTIKVERVSGGYRATIIDDSLCVKKGVYVSKFADILVELERVLPLESVPWEAIKSFKNKGGAKVPGEKVKKKG